MLQVPSRVRMGRNGHDSQRWSASGKGYFSRFTFADQLFERLPYTLALPTHHSQRALIGGSISDNYRVNN